MDGWMAMAKKSEKSETARIGITERAHVHVKGRVRARIHDLETDTWTITPWGDNLVTDDGKELFSKLMCGDSSEHATYCAVGSGTAPASESDSALQSEIGRLIITDYSVSGASVTYSTFFGSADCNGTWGEAGLLTASSGGILIDRYVFGTALVKNSTKTITVDIELTVT